MEAYVQQPQFYCVDWSGAPLSAPQRFVIQQIAILFLRKGDDREKFNFTHELVEGRMEIQRKGIFGAVAGTFIHVDMGRVRGKRWTLDFLLPRGAENIEFKEGDKVAGLATGPDGTLRVTLLDTDQYKASEVSILG